METVGAFEAKTHLSDLLERVEQGEAFTITRHGKPVAKLVPAASARSEADAREAVERLLEFGRGRSLKGLTIRELIDEGRRF